MALLVAATAACTEEFKPPPKKESPAWGTIEPPKKASIAALVGTDKSKLGFETTAILGASPDAITKAFGGHMASRTTDGKIERLTLDGWLDIEGVGKTRRKLFVTLVWDGDKVFSYELLLPDTIEAELVEALSKARGPATGRLDRDIGVWFGDSTSLYVIERGLRLVVRSKAIKPEEAKQPYAGRKTPTEIVGSATDRFAFEPVPLLGANWDQLAELTIRREDLGKDKSVGFLRLPGVLDLPGYFGAARDLELLCLLDDKGVVLSYELRIPLHKGLVEAFHAARGPVADSKEDGTQVLAKGPTYVKASRDWLQIRVGGEADAWLLDGSGQFRE
ncbi:MAG: hypothetical protein KJO07_24405 [Deltaproteobacteria bacterium]|nr:hypothetical protein [Deltaproteobacteria bacterium]